MPDEFWVDSRGFAWVGDVRLPFKYYRETKILEFVDKDRSRSEQRGSRIIRVTVTEIINSERIVNR